MSRFLAGVTEPRHRGSARPSGSGTARLRVHTAGLIAFTAACLCPPLHAQSSQVHTSIALASQLVDRGLAITPATPILQGSVSWTSRSGWSLSLAGGVETRSPDHLVVVLARASRVWALSNDWQAKASLLYYDYGTASHAYADHRTDTSLYFTYRDVLTFGVAAMHASHGRHSELLGAADLDLRWPLTRHVSLSLGAGMAQTTVVTYNHGSYQHGGYTHAGYTRAHVRRYGYGHLGLVWQRGHWQLKLDRIVTSLHTRQEYGAQNSSPWLATLALSF